MPTVVILNTGQRVDWQRGTLLDALLSAGIALPHYCGGNAACATCHVFVRQGGQGLVAAEDVEEDWFSIMDDATPRSRLACQTRAGAAPEVVVIEIPGEF